MDITLHVGPQRLSDGSLVYNVYFGPECKMKLQAVTQEDANTLASEIASLINHHTVDSASVRAW